MDPLLVEPLLRHTQLSASTSHIGKPCAAGSGDKKDDIWFSFSRNTFDNTPMYNVIFRKCRQNLVE
ncbi:hypothetical protein BVI434_280025 [Burkholderia vietnamiensis]|nr:hypothetical protein BVI434_280025 [Burkholderia vietnamiensis]